MVVGLGFQVRAAQAAQPLVGGPQNTQVETAGHPVLLVLAVLVAAVLAAMPVTVAQEGMLVVLRGAWVAGALAD